MMNRQIRVEKIIGTVKCVATCGTIEIQAENGRPRETRQPPIQEQSRSLAIDQIHTEIKTGAECPRDDKLRTGMFAVSKREIRLLSRISFLIYSAGAVVNAVS